jgi:hypothetical protein
MKNKKTAKTNSSILHQVIQQIPKGLPDNVYCKAKCENI